MTVHETPLSNKIFRWEFHQCRNCMTDVPERISNRIIFHFWCFKKASGKWGGSVYRCLSDLLTAQALIITSLSWREKIPLFSFIPRTSAWHNWFRRTESISESLEGEETAQVHSESRLHNIHTQWKLLTERSRLPNICIWRILQ